MLLAAAVLAVTSLVLATPARAQTESPPGAAPDPGAGASADQFTWAVEPSGPEGPGNRDAFVFDAAPGERLVDTVAISNLSTEPLTVSIYAADAFNTADGGFALTLEDTPQRGVGDWSSLATNIHTIEPRSRIDVPFEVNIPADAEPGDHAGAILATASDETGTPLRSETVPGSNVTLDRRVGARVYLRVDGPLRPAVQVTKIALEYDSPATPLQKSPATVTYEVQNTGNVRMPLHAEVRLGGPLGRVLGEGAARDYPELLPGGRVVVSESLGEVAPWLRMTATVTATSDELRVRRSASSLALPWPTVLLIAAIVGWRIVRRRRRAVAATGPRGDGGPPGRDGPPGAGPPGTRDLRPGQAGSRDYVGRRLAKSGARPGPSALMRRASAAIAASRRPGG